MKRIGIVSSCKHCSAPVLIFNAAGGERAIVEVEALPETRYVIEDGVARKVPVYSDHLNACRKRLLPGMDTDSVRPLKKKYPEPGR